MDLFIYIYYLYLYDKSSYLGRVLPARVAVYEKHSVFTVYGIKWYVDSLMLPCILLVLVRFLEMCIYTYI